MGNCGWVYYVRMAFENLSPNPEVKSDASDDNARKFVVAGSLSPEYLRDMKATGFRLTVDWLEMSDDRETKLVYKEYDDGEVQLLRITKEANEEGRRARKTPVAMDHYLEAVADSQRRVLKRRHEFKHVQHKMIFNMKYDEFEGSDLRLIEVDAPTDEERRSFDHTDFVVGLEEVSDDPHYTGYRVAEVL